MSEPDRPALESDVIHQFKNHLAIIVGFCDLLVEEIPEGDPKRADLLEIHKAGRAAMALLPELAARMT
jgi:hypothetical protein